MATSAMTADQILSEINPFKILDEGDVGGSFRQMSLRWHPDKPGGNKDVFVKLTNTRDQLESLVAGAEEIDHVRVFKSIDGSSSRVIFNAKTRTDTGVMYLCRGVVVLVDEKALAGVLNKRIPEFHFEDDKMRKAIQYFIPNPKEVEVFEEKDRIVHVFKKDKDLIPLQSLIDYLAPGSMQPVHAAWIVSRMLHVACYLRYANIVHSGFNTTNLFVNPVTHGASLIGGWRLARKTGELLPAIPAFTIRCAPRSIIEKRISDHSLDLCAIKAIAKMLFGDIGGRNFHKDTPKSVRKWLILPSGRNAVDEYHSWEEALKGFGPRKFVDMNVNPASVYKKIISS